jgi:hypothetical protein
VFNGAVSVSGADDLQLVSGHIGFNNTLSLSGALRVGAAAVTFNNATDNAIGAFTMLGNGGDVTVDTAAGVNFYNGGKIQHNADGTLTFNHANVLGDGTDINVNGKVVNYNFNADEDLGFIALGAGTMNLTMGEGVASLVFDDSSAQDWAGGALVISNFTSGVLGFGTDANGLMSAQIESITAYDAGGSAITGLALDANGIMIPEPATLGLIGIVGLAFLAARRLMV